MYVVVHVVDRKMIKFLRGFHLLTKKIHTLTWNQELNYKSDMW